MDTTPTTQNNEEEKVVKRSPDAEEYTETTFRDFMAQITFPNRKIDTIICITFLYFIFFLFALRIIYKYPHGTPTIIISLIYISHFLISLIDLFFDKKGEFYYDPIKTFKTKFFNSVGIMFPIIVLFILIAFIPKELHDIQSLKEYELLCIILIIPDLYIIYIVVKHNFLYSDHNIYIHNYMYDFYTKYKKLNYTDEQIINLFDSLDHNFKKYPLYYISKK